MASNPYEVEHNIKSSSKAAHSRRPDMSSFTSHLHSISRDADSSTSSTHHHAGPTPVDAAALFTMVQEQMATLANSAPSDTNRDFLVSLIDALRSDVDNPPEQIRGVAQEYLDSLDRVPKKSLRADDSCPICAENYLDDPYPLVVELPCHGAHRFDLECVGPWLQSKGTCPLCRKDLTEKKKIPVPVDDDEEEDDMDGLYG
ncbi:hypothetical protein BKA67DRAFT_403519 [Truncatella angustata]|uniref:RING-type domain-containing protein n=1 Tax=Truncatella angustata TaxID=152316 RepID=A0A9P8UDN7_9PEZI|nr:uncharacterized protein BKA67DRAFT_403519 [Truncatella angustata]KAH6648006.1 hypothetical protein BKA67DRAFT_403519 [Truncatella angustata]KAH8194379.1 hypothetical protein TruAng_011462 [Truncatella angustata]